ncbi:phosphatase PAP2 family protein [Chryseobacterium potabilaquae]|uniref:Phosphatidic acid phosphatase type 2/haloperoxidase domain-containing protein n=1 Tax=Chryseobacterium potabilaquae TaxID=2675057 RepID=A0A6N4X8K8_9FLAO|nr:phosphatase PAP2 family protein [Chryseobacterium potabilaquae]CAA7195646.1 hypothetical protein CHRY9293_01819 [Chryseobacterium potabilaquae]
MKKNILTMMAILAFFESYAQDTTRQTRPLSLVLPEATPQKTFFQKEWVKKSIAPTILFTAAAATWGEKENIRELRNRYIPNFKVPYDDYLQYTPAVAVYGLKLAGVKGRNNIGRATLSHGASLAIMAILVNSIKYTTKVERPDGSSKNSFPSGHTAMAFTNASFLHKEYGLVSPAYSIGGYTVATLTGVGRNFNNRHWVPDILAGAGIGILSTELGYFFIDKIYKNKGDNLGILSRIEGNENPSFLSIKLGTALATTNFLSQAELSEKKEVGFEAGLEGAYFFSKQWGIGGDFTFSSFPVKPVNIFNEQDLGSFDFVTQSLGFLNFGIGPYFSQDLSEKLQLTLKTTAGYSSAANGKVFIKANFIDSPTEEIEIAEYRPSNSFRFNIGTALTYKLNPELGLTLYADYNQTKSKITYHYNNFDEETNDEYNSEQIRENIRYFTIGLRLTAYF